MYYKLLHTKEDCLLSANGNITFEGAQYVTNKELSPFPWSDVVLDWMHAIGGQAFVEHIFCVFYKDLAIETLHDIGQRVINNIDTLKMEAENTSKACQLRISRTVINNPPAHSESVSLDQVNFNNHGKFPQNQRATVCPPVTISQQPAKVAGGVTPPNSHCTYCRSPQAKTHTILTCLMLKNYKKEMLKTEITATTSDHNIDLDNKLFN